MSRWELVFTELGIYVSDRFSDPSSRVFDRRLDSQTQELVFLVREVNDVRNRVKSLIKITKSAYWFLQIIISIRDKDFASSLSIKIIWNYHLHSCSNKYCSLPVLCRTFYRLFVYFFFIGLLYVTLTWHDAQ